MMSIAVDSPALPAKRVRRMALFAVSVVVALATADLVFACTFWHALYHLPPLRVLQNIAAGLLGRRAFVGGVQAGALGGLLHYTIMGVMVGAYYAAVGRLKALRDRPWLYGALYGAVLYVVMNGVVVPLSAAPKTPFVPSWILCSIAMHMLIGMMIAWSARCAWREQAIRMVRCDS